MKLIELERVNGIAARLSSFFADILESDGIIILDELNLADIREMKIRINDIYEEMERPTVTALGNLENCLFLSIGTGRYEIDQADLDLISNAHSLIQKEYYYQCDLRNDECLNNHGNVEENDRLPEWKRKIDLSKYEGLTKEKKEILNSHMGKNSFPVSMTDVLHHHKYGEFDLDQEWYRTGKWQKGEQEAEEDIAMGRVKSFGNAKEAIEFLRSEEREEE